VVPLARDQSRTDLAKAWWRLGFPRGMLSVFLVERGEAFLASGAVPSLKTDLNYADSGHALIGALRAIPLVSGGRSPGPTEEPRWDAR